MELTTEILEKLKKVTAHNERILEAVDGDQGLAVGLIEFLDEAQDASIWNPFYDSSMRFQIVPNEEYTENQLQSMLDQLEEKGI